MNRSKLLSRLVGGISVVATAAMVTFSGCTNIDTSLGSDLTPDNQAMKVGQMDIDCRLSNYFESRLYKTDSINSASLSYGYFGIMGDEVFGTRSAAFVSQYIPSYTLDDDIFGYMPIFDSAVLYISVEGYGGDTSVVQYFEVFEVIDNSFITESADSIFFPNFDPTPYLASEPVFTFKFPDQPNGVYTSATSVTMQETDQTADLIKRLMLEEITGDYDEDIYDDHEDWVEEFKGLYIRPVADLEPITAGKAGAIYATTLESSGFGFYGRSREEDDPTIVLDTIGMSYVFYSDYADAGNISINCLDNNYEGSQINIADVKTPETTDADVPLVSTLRVEAMVGVVSEITFTPEFFEQLDTILETEEDDYTSLFFNQAKMKIYMEEITSYDIADIDPYVVTPVMNELPTSLGLYTDYSFYYVEDEDYEDEYYVSLMGVADYIYAYESSYTLDYGGALNRSWGCYVFNIPGHIQDIWNSYLEAKEEAEENGTEINWDDVEDRKVYLAPTYSTLFSAKYASLQAGVGTSDIASEMGVDEVNSAPIYLELTYTMIR